MRAWKKFTHREHILARPDTYVGPIEQVLKKIFQEIIVNASDEYIRDPKANRIDVTVSEDLKVIRISNNKFIPVVKQDGIWVPELIFGHLLTSSNFDDTQTRYVGGRNGYGAKLTSIFSKRFTITSCDPENTIEYTQTWRDNMSVCEEPRMKKYTKKSGKFTVEFEPDETRVQPCTMDDLREITCDTGLWVPNVYFNEESVSSTFEKFMQTHLQQYAYMKAPGWEIMIGKTPDGEGFKQHSFVNGIRTYRGGTHVDYILSEVSKALKCRSSQLRSHVIIGVKLEIDKPVFSSQTKNELENVFTSGTLTLKPKFIKDLIACGIDKAVDGAKLKKTDGTRKSTITGIPELDDANWAGTNKSESCVLFVTEGLSAKALVISGMSVVGRNAYGVFSLRGKPKNVRETSVTSLETNKEFTNLKKILGLKHGVEYKDTRSLRYGKLFIMTDADLDGAHIKGLVLNIFHVFWPSLIKIGFVNAMVTPVVKRGPEWFYTEEAYRNAPQKSGTTKYYKGLGTSTSAEAKEYFKMLDKLSVQFTWDDTVDDSMNLAFSKTQSSKRKTWLADYKPDKFVNYGHLSRLEVSEFINVDFIKFSIEDTHRSIPHLVDGLKPSQRNVIFAGKRKGNLTTEINVGQFCGYIGEHTEYHHGETSLHGTVVGMGQDFVGSGNNMNLLMPVGQFGSRTHGGSDAASVRYLFTQFSPWTSILFDSRDDSILCPGNPVPEFYVPILPMCLVNGGEGIGTGFSCKIPPFNPSDIKANILRILDRKPLEKMTPWFRGFRGKTTKIDDSSWLFEGTVTKMSAGKCRVTELPPGVWTQKFKESLEADQLKYENHSTDEAADFIVYSDELPIPHKVVHASNMHLITPSGIQKFDSAEHILFEYSKIRLKFYKSRKVNLIKVTNEKLEKLIQKSKFISCVMSESIKVFGRPIQEVKSDMDAMNLSHELLKTRIDEYTGEKLNELREQIEELTRVLSEITACTPADMWKKDLDRL